MPDDEPYLTDRLAWHLASAVLDDELETTVANVSWLGRRIATHPIQAAEADLAVLITTTGSASGQRLMRLVMQVGYVARNLNTVDAIASLDQFVRQVHPAAAAAPADLLRLALIAAWNPPGAPDPALLRTLQGHTDWVRAVAVAPDGTIITASDDQTVRLWNPNTGDTIRTLTGHTGGVTAVAVAADGTIITASDDQTVRIWNPAHR